MNKKYLLVIGGLLAALLVVGIVGATSAYAQGPDNPGFGLMENGRGPGGGRGFGLGDAELEAAANVLGMTTDEVTAALNDGKTLQDLATEAGVDIADVHAAVQAVKVTEFRDRIAQARSPRKKPTGLSKASTRASSATVTGSALASAARTDAVAARVCSPNLPSKVIDVPITIK
jgi:hypothetical protein